MKSWSQNRRSRGFCGFVCAHTRANPQVFASFGVVARFAASADVSLALSLSPSPFRSIFFFHENISLSGYIAYSPVASTRDCHIDIRELQTRRLISIRPCARDAARDFKTLFRKRYCPRGIVLIAAKTAGFSKIMLATT